MGLRLTIHRLDGTAIEYHDEVPEAIRKEADHAAAQAAGDPLGGPTSEYVREQVITGATERLRRPGDTYQGPAGATWTLKRA
jgi:hypothetical protein